MRIQQSRLVQLPRLSALPGHSGTPPSAPQRLPSHQFHTAFYNVHFLARFQGPNRHPSNARPGSSGLRAGNLESLNCAAIPATAPVVISSASRVISPHRLPPGPLSPQGRYEADAEPQVPQRRGMSTGNRIQKEFAFIKCGSDLGASSDRPHISEA